jgi:hypothetical protein
MRRALTALLIGSAVTVSLAGCPSEPASSGASGTVVARNAWKCGWDGEVCRRHSVTVKEDGGKADKGRVSRDVYRSCHVGDRWPDCKKEAKK